VDAAGDVNASGNVHCVGVYATGGLFQIGPNYYLARGAADGFWRFVENGTVNFTVQTDGGASARGDVRANNGRVFSIGAGNNPVFTCWDTTHGIAAGLLLGADNQLYLANVDGNGAFQSSRLHLDASGNTVVAGTFAANGGATSLYVSGSIHALNWESYQFFMDTSTGMWTWQRWDGWAQMWLDGGGNCRVHGGFYGGQRLRAETNGTLTRDAPEGKAMSTDELFVAMSEQIAALQARVAALEARP
jgi:hypothetical protein